MGAGKKLAIATVVVFVGIPAVMGAAYYLGTEIKAGIAREGVIVTPSDYPEGAWPWPDVKEARLQCHGHRGNPEVTLEMPSGKVYGLNGDAIDAGWPALIDTLKRNEDGIFERPIPPQMTQAGIALCPEHAEDTEIGHCLSRVTGAPTQLYDALAPQLRDPGSFSPESTRVNSPDVHGVVKFITSLRAKNAFGGYAMATAKGRLEVSDCSVTLDAVDED